MELHGCSYEDHLEVLSGNFYFQFLPQTNNKGHKF